MLRPKGFTRIGPALRHGCHRLEELSVKKRMILLVTDAKPTDYDHYEGEYGIQDVRQAALDVQARRVAIECLAIGKGSEKLAGRLFGSNVNRCTRADQLPDLIFRAFFKMIRGC